MKYKNNDIKRIKKILLTKKNVYKKKLTINQFLVIFTFCYRKKTFPCILNMLFKKPTTILLWTIQKVLNCQCLQLLQLPLQLVFRLCGFNQYYKARLKDNFIMLQRDFSKNLTKQSLVDKYSFATDYLRIITGKLSWLFKKLGLD